MPSKTTVNDERENRSIPRAGDVYELDDGLVVVDANVDYVSYFTGKHIGSMVEIDNVMEELTPANKVTEMVITIIS